MSVCDSHLFCQLIAHGMSGSRSGNLNCLSALKTSVQDFFRCVRISGQIGFQIVKYSEDRQKRMYAAVLCSASAPVTFNSLGKRVKRDVEAGERFSLDLIEGE